MNTETLSTDVVHSRLVHAVSEYDRKQAGKKYYNRYALAQYFGAIENVDEALRRGKPVRQAVVSSFCGRLLDICLKAIGEPVSTDSEQRY